MFDHIELFVPKCYPYMPFIANSYNIPLNMFHLVSSWMEKNTEGYFSHNRK